MTLGLLRIREMILTFVLTFILFGNCYLARKERREYSVLSYQHKLERNCFFSPVQCFLNDRFKDLQNPSNLWEYSQFPTDPLFNR
ncbi:unnamed protein product, partial [Mesorhabditis belari]|uniref:Uncharacterized protein n=1 Tax=Mesorhabditis belari TaxID=2138241 RepID=A0AAF3EE35_9BILA